MVVPPTEDACSTNISSCLSHGPRGDSLCTDGAEDAGKKVACMHVLYDPKPILAVTGLVLDARGSHIIYYRVAFSSSPLELYARDLLPPSYPIKRGGRDTSSETRSGGKFFIVEWEESQVKSGSQLAIDASISNQAQIVEEFM